ncbi:MAG: hypothetical protein RB296_06585 [Acidobacteriota bacterium]|jgi:hypothetical protein|nr:hypothetical protein [Acidobacteriota bacterium]
MQKRLRATAFIVLILFALLVMPIMRYRKEANLASLPSRYVKGVYASAFSREQLLLQQDSICQTANELSLNFVLLHVSDPDTSVSTDTAAWCRNTLIIESAKRVADNDVINLFFHLEKVPLLSRIVMASRYLFNSSYALLSAVDPAGKSLPQWDQATRRRQNPGIFNLGPWGGLSLPGFANGKLPSFRAKCETLTVYARIKRELVKDPRVSMSILLQAIADGHFFNAIEAIAPANGFDACFFPANGPEVVQMGDMDPRYKGKLRVNTPFTFPTQVFLVRNGEPAANTPPRLQKQVIWDIDKPGVYRVEVRVPRNRFSHLPWIITNPFYLGDTSEEHENNTSNS